MSLLFLRAASQAGRRYIARCSLTGSAGLGLITKLPRMPRRRLVPDQPALGSTGGLESLRKRMALYGCDANANSDQSDRGKICLDAAGFGGTALCQAGGWGGCCSGGQHMTNLSNLSRNCSISTDAAGRILPCIKEEARSCIGDRTNNQNPAPSQGGKPRRQELLRAKRELGAMGGGRKCFSVGAAERACSTRRRRPNLSRASIGPGHLQPPRPSLSCMTRLSIGRPLPGNPGLLGNVAPPNVHWYGVKR